MAARPIFVLSSGRSGSATLARLLSGRPDIEMHHEYLCTHIQEAACRYAMGLAGEAETRRAIERLHGAAIHYARTPLWGDSSNKLSFVSALLVDLFPEARFVHLTRDGRKVAGSYARKLADECYDDRSVAILAGHVRSPAAHPAPPPEKRYWWPIPRAPHPMAERFAAFSQFERVAFHWAWSNEAILEGLGAAPASRVARVRLEDLRARPSAVGELLDFVGLAPRGDEFAALQRPHNVNRPEDRPLTPDERARFEAIATDMMHRLGYGESEEYVVNY
ncbi:MAG: sulfotransferase [Alphaproteobacteria bacterium]|nr:sulfotransferase [Alphaproteobacteria bacterium]